MNPLIRLDHSRNIASVGSISTLLELNAWAKSQAEMLRDYILRISPRLVAIQSREVWHELSVVTLSILSPTASKDYEYRGSRFYSEENPDQCLIRHVLELLDRAAAYKEPQVEKPPVAGLVSGGRSYGGRPRLGEGPNVKAEDIALRNVYEQIRSASKLKSGAKTLYNHFRNDKDFKDRVKEAGREFNIQLMENALAWINANPASKETPSGKVS